MMADKPRSSSAIKLSLRGVQIDRQTRKLRLNSYIALKTGVLEPLCRNEVLLKNERTRARTRVLCRNHCGADVSQVAPEITPTRLIRRITLGAWLWKARNRSWLKKSTSQPAILHHRAHLPFNATFAHQLPAQWFISIFFLRTMKSRRKRISIRYSIEIGISQFSCPNKYYWAEKGEPMRQREGNCKNARQILFFHPEFNSSVIFIATDPSALHLIERSKSRIYFPNTWPPYRDNGTPTCSRYGNYFPAGVVLRADRLVPLELHQSSRTVTIVVT